MTCETRIPKEAEMTFELLSVKASGTGPSVTVCLKLFIDMDCESTAQSEHKNT